MCSILFKQYLPALSIATGLSRLLFWVPYLLLCLALAPFNAKTTWAQNGEDPRFIENVEQFRRHINLHVKRVQALGLALLEQYPEKYGEVDQELLKEFLAIHDLAKRSDDLQYLQNMGNTLSDTPFYMQLWRYYGQRGTDNHIQAIHVYKNLNQVDTNIRNSFLLSRGVQLESPQAKLLFRIESLADVVDRGMDPVAMEEMGKITNKASKVHEGSGTLQKEALFLEENYPRITAGLSYSSKKRAARVRACLIKNLGGI